MKSIVLSLALALSAPAAFAADSTSARRYGSSEALSVQDARLGEVLMVRTVQLKSDQRLNAGSAIGAAVGYGAANQVKSRDYRNAARVAGGVIGAVAGTAVQKGLSGRTAVEIYVRDLSDRRQRVLAVVQDADVDVREGDRVFLVGKGKKTRVVPLDASPVRIGDYSCGSPCAIGINARSDNNSARVRVGP
ncbi:glycine zipper 2TM domain-containing protein [Stenotrophomonas maltophilia]|nr:glycine zipper 2TM domain-containing protein [Stenotrophomonas maltophilia]MBN4961028.1 glycine zipper 2TM domain-containing protein [Stenotrophomonas maltophilia]